MITAQLTELFNNPLITALTGAVLGVLLGLMLMQMAKLKLNSRHNSQLQQYESEQQTLQQQVERFQVDQTPCQRSGGLSATGIAAEQRPSSRIRARSGAIAAGRSAKACAG